MKIEQANSNFSNKPIFTCLTFGIIAFGIRLYFNFSQDLIPGINGGYYPLQVRYVLNNWHLGFPDMPLLFYLDAILIKLISLFGVPITDNLILNVVKIIDSISIPLILFPVYKILRLSKPTTYKYFSTSIIAFSVLSFSPLILKSDLQKNAVAIVFMFTSVSYFLSYLNKKNKLNIYFSILFFLLTGITHFGTFAFALFFMIITIPFYYKQKAIMPLVILTIISLGLIAIFDISRFTRLISFWTDFFDKPALINKMLLPPDFGMILISLLLAGFGIFILKTKGDRLVPYQKAITFSSVICLFILSFPLLDVEYFKRLSLFLFIPQILLILQIAQVLDIAHLKTISFSLILITSLSVFAVIVRPVDTILNKSAYENLKELRTVIKNDNETIIIARHGLEWWTGWLLKTKVGQDKSIDKTVIEKYKNIVFLNQINGFGNNRQRTPFHEPRVPPNAYLIYSSEYFKAYRFNH
jgi:hypothetical protein